MGDIQYFCHGISIHAPHARSDCFLVLSARSLPNFNPRSSCEERRNFEAGRCLSHNFNPRSSCEERRACLADGTEVFLFQSTLLMRGATVDAVLSHRRRAYFNPRSSCEERLYDLRQLCLSQRISIHAPHARSDRMVGRQSIRLPFQSTLLMRGATTGTL